MSSMEFIKECQEKVFSGERISGEDAKKLFNVPDEDLKELARCANEITRDYNGNKVDVEQLNNIKKNACSEDCTFCGQSAFYDTGFKLFDPLDGLKVPEQLKQAITLKNRSYLSTVIGLAFRKLDVFGYYKFVTAVKNINLLPNRKSVIKEKKIKAVSNFAFKGVVGGVIGIYLILFTLSFWNIHSYNKKLNNYENVLSMHVVKTKEKAKSTKELGLITKTLELSKSLKSNKEISYRVLAQIASSVPNRVKFESVDYNGKSQVIIQGVAASDQDILRLIGNLSSKNLIQQASLTSMQLPTNSNATGQPSKGFKIFVKIKKG